MIHVDSTCAPIMCAGEACISKGSHKGMSLVGVFDGHGGKRCSRFAGQHMPENFHVALSELGVGSAKAGSSDFATAFRIAYRMTHDDFARLARGANEADRPKTRQRVQEALQKARGSLLEGADRDALDKLHSTYPQEELSLAALRTKMMQQRLALGPRVWDDGSTALCCLVHGSRAVVANAGDSRAVACIAGRTVPLSTDHKPNLPAERARIHLAGGTVTSL
jgi:serine/threonine protein phosphatase PrpC